MGGGGGGRYELTRKHKLHVCASLFPVILCVGVSPDLVHGWCLMGLHNTTLVLTARYLTGFLSFLLLALCLCPCSGFCVCSSVSDSLGLLLPPFLTLSLFRSVYVTGYACLRFCLCLPVFLRLICVSLFVFYMSVVVAVYACRCLCLCFCL